MNAPGPANCKKDEEYKATCNTGGSTEGQTSDQVIESTEASRPSGGEHKQGSPSNIMKVRGQLHSHIKINVHVHVDTHTCIHVHEEIHVHVSRDVHVYVGRSI